MTQFDFNKCDANELAAYRDLKVQIIIKALKDFQKSGNMSLDEAVHWSLTLSEIIVSMAWQHSKGINLAAIKWIENTCLGMNEHIKELILRNEHD